jgi:hypothetical protein
MTLAKVGRRPIVAPNYHLNTVLYYYGTYNNALFTNCSS